MNVLITRPSPDGEQLVNKLLSLGKFAYHLPLIYFSKGKSLSLLKQQLDFLAEGDFLFIVSRNAILFAHNYLLNIGVSWPKKLLYYSIGEATSNKMRDLSGLAVKYSNIQETSEGLLALPELNCISGGKKALILRGNDGRAVLENTLQKRGVHVVCCECYSRHFLKHNGTEQCLYMLSLEINTVIITSEGILMQLYYLIPRYYRIYWLIQCQLIVVSVRLALCAKRLGWKNIIVACSANNDVLARVVMQYHNKSVENKIC